MEVYNAQIVKMNTKVDNQTVKSVYIKSSEMFRICIIIIINYCRKTSVGLYN